MFIPISVERYAELFVKDNPGSERGAVRRRLERALADFQGGARCDCGAPIWVVGSAEAGRACFTCITGEPTPEDDYEIAEAC